MIYVPGFQEALLFIRRMLASEHVTALTWHVSNVTWVVDAKTMMFPSSLLSYQHLDHACEVTIPTLPRYIVLCIWRVVLDLQAFQGS